MSKELVAGAKAPTFNLPRDGGGIVSLKEFKGRNLVLYFYPKADTPGCTKEALAFSRLRAEFAKADTADAHTSISRPRRHRLRAFSWSRLIQAQW